MTIRSAFQPDQMEMGQPNGAPLVRDPKIPDLQVRAFDDTTAESIYIRAIASAKATKVKITLTARGDEQPVAFLIVAHIREEHPPAPPGQDPYLNPPIRHQPLGLPDDERTQAFMALWYRAEK